jgi:hypothetical protein
VGRFLRTGRHECQFPHELPGVGSIWRCDCGRRWTLKLVGDRHEWSRRVLPWPR